MSRATNLDSNSQSEPSLNPQQIKRIEAVHRGFLYQHLYAAACLLTTVRRDSMNMLVEHDEDIELTTDNYRYYIQVKTRSSPLQLGDISDTLDRFNAIRREHSEGRRAGIAIFKIVSSIELGTKLAKDVGGDLWPEDVSIITPAAKSDTVLPPAWKSLEDALKWCIDVASTVPFGILSPETLVWKLASHVQYAASGAHSHRFNFEAIPILFEQLLVQLQDFPEPPENYRPQQNEPPLISEARVRIISGFSGAGKTAWSSNAALHCPNPICYYDVGNLPADSTCSSLARELTARFISAEGGGTIFGEKVGVGVLQACAKALAERDMLVTVVLDNAHRLTGGVIMEIINAAPKLKFILIAQPWTEQGLVESLCQIQAEYFEGWSRDDIALEARTLGTPVSVSAAERIRHLTGGLPLYVRSFIEITKTNYEGDAVRFCDAIDSQTHTETSAQELILQRFFAHFDEDTRRALAILSYFEVPVTNEEAFELLKFAFRNDKLAARLIRELKVNALIVKFQRGYIAIHDAMRPVASAHTTFLESGLEHGILIFIIDLVIRSLTKERNIPRLILLFRLLPRAGQVETLVDLATQEMFYEQGDQQTLRIELEKAANNIESPIPDRYWAHDALAYWESRDGGYPEMDRLRTMRRLIEEGNLSNREKLGLSMKEMVVAAREGETEKLDDCFSKARALTTPGTENSRLLRYNYAVALDRINDFPRVMAIAEQLIEEYYGLVGIDEREVFMAKNQELFDKLRRTVDFDDVKRLADALFLWSAASVSLHRPPGLRRIHAMKFYAIAQAGRSAVSAGLEATDDFLDIMGDAIGARELMEQHILPMTEAFRLIDMLLEVRSSYAVILAWCGEGQNALGELNRLSEYLTSEDENEMIRARRMRIEDILSGKLQLIRHSPSTSISFHSPRTTKSDVKPARNAVCPCGSGKKYKRCHGRTQ